MLLRLLFTLADQVRCCWWRWLDGVQLWQQAQVAGPQLKELAEPLDIIGAGKSGAAFPTRDHHVTGSANAISDHFLGPSSLQACPAQQLIGSGLRCFLDHGSVLPTQGIVCI